MADDEPVWVVLTDEYDIAAIFSTLEKAERYTERMNKGTSYHWRIEPWAIDGVALPERGDADG